MTKRIITIIFSLLLIPALANSQSIKYEGKDFFINGANIPWNNFGFDVGSGYNALWFEDMFTKAEKCGVNCLRLWIHCDGRGTPTISVNGYVIGISTMFYNSFDDIFEKAKNHHIMLMPCLWSFDMTNANHASLIQDSLKTQSYIDSILVPMVKRYANQCNLFAWEIINEPEWSMKVNGGGSTKQTVSAKEMQRFVGMQAAAIHRNSSKMVNVGSAALKWNSTAQNCIYNNWNDSALKSAANDTLAFLDFYQIHYYNWMYPDFDPFDLTKPVSFWKLDKPVLVGETPGKDIRHPSKMMLDNAYKNKLAGVMFWSIAANDGVSTFSDFKVSLSDFRLEHIDSIWYSCDPNEKPLLNSIFNIAYNKIVLKVDSNSSSILPISSTIPWKIINNVSWLKIIPDTFNSSNTAVFYSVSSNTNTNDRIDTVWISAPGKPLENIIVTQLKPYLSVSPTILNISKKETSISTFSISTNIKWKITGIDTTWFIVYPDSGIGSATVTVMTTSNNESGEIKTAQLKIINNNNVPSTYITINQEVSSKIITDNNALIISPNPTTGLIKLLIDDCYLDITSTSGQVVYSSKTKGNQTINLSNLDNGIYFLKAKNGNKQYLQKLIILK